MSIKLAFGHSLLVRRVGEFDSAAKAPAITLLSGEAQCAASPMQLYTSQPVGAAGATTVVDCVAPDGCGVDVVGCGRSTEIRVVPLACAAIERAVTKICEAQEAATTGRGVAPRVLVVGAGNEGITSWAATSISNRCGSSSVVLELHPEATLSKMPGTAALRFCDGGDRSCLESYNFFLGGGGFANVDTVLDVAGVARDMVAAVSASRSEFAAAGFVVDAGDIDSAALAASVVPKLLRQLRVSHLVLLVGASAKSVEVRDSVAAAAADFVRGVVLEVVRVGFASRYDATGDQQQQQQQQQQHQRASAASVFRYFRGAVRPFARPARLILSAASVSLLDATTFQPLPSVLHVRRFCLCGVAAPVVVPIGDGGLSASAALSHGAKRAVVGFVVVVEVGPNSLVVIAPVPGDLPSKVLYVANDILVPPEVLPSVLETV